MAHDLSLEDDEGISVFKHVLLLEALETDDFFFLQAGGHDGVTFDPLRNFAKRFQWKGVVLEPQPAVYAKLVENYRDCPGVTCLNVAAGEVDGDVALYKFEDSPDVPEHATMLASFDRSALEHNGHAYRFPIEKIIVKALSLKTLIHDYCKGRLTFLQVDTEGYDYNIVRQIFDLEPVMLPRLIRFEKFMSDMQLKELEVGLRAKGYKVQAFTEFRVSDVIATLRDFGDLEDRKIAVQFAPPVPPALTLRPVPFESVLSTLPPQLEREIGKLLCTLGFRQTGSIIFDKANARIATYRAR